MRICQEGERHNSRSVEGLEEGCVGKAGKAGEAAVLWFAQWAWWSVMLVETWTSGLWSGATNEQLAVVRAGLRQGLVVKAGGRARVVVRKM